MRRPWQIWITFGLAVLLMCGALTWLSVKLLDFEQEREQRRAEGELEERVRQALWQIDSRVMPILAQENSWPHFAYRPYYGPAKNSEPPIASPLLTPTNDFVRLNFEIGPDNKVSSPQAPPEKYNAWAISNGSTNDLLTSSNQRVHDLQMLCNRGELLDQLPPETLGLSMMSHEVENWNPGNFGIITATPEAGQQTLNLSNSITLNGTAANFPPLEIGNGGIVGPPAGPAGVTLNANGGTLSIITPNDNWQRSSLNATVGNPWAMTDSMLNTLPFGGAVAAGMPISAALQSDAGLTTMANWSFTNGVVNSNSTTSETMQLTGANSYSGATLVNPNTNFTNLPQTGQVPENRTTSGNSAQRSEPAQGYANSGNFRYAVPRVQYNDNSDLSGNTYLRGNTYGNRGSGGQNSTPPQAANPPGKPVAQPTPNAPPAQVPAEPQQQTQVFNNDVVVANNTAQYDSPLQQQAKNSLDLQMRSRAFQQLGINSSVTAQKLVQNQKEVAAALAPSTSNVREGMGQPIWVGEELLFARRVNVDGNLLIQGCWLDWPKLRDWLKSEISELLPQVEIVPAVAEEATARGRMLATLPAKLEVPPAVYTPVEWLTPVRGTLAFAWGGAGLAAGAVGLLLAGVVTLSERRGAFVSAVTHELRTPLTTFRMYAEMLSEGMVTDPEQAKHYLQTLRAEADRLTHLVSNVLTYARLERTKLSDRLRVMTIADLLDRCRERLLERAQQGGLELVESGEERLWATEVKADAAVVEQILFNLVDNAGKYAASATDRRLHLNLERQGRHIRIAICDHGPGVSAKEASRLFQPFRKSAKDAANSAPGVGLGLALCRRLAAELGGQIVNEQRPEFGAYFVLILPAVSFAEPSA